jgi:hypothetical protein
MAPVRRRIEGTELVCEGELKLRQVDTGPEVRPGEVRCLVFPQRKRLSLAETDDHVAVAVDTVITVNGIF